MLRVTALKPYRVEFRIRAGRDAVRAAVSELPVLRQWFGWDFDGLEAEIRQLFVDQLMLPVGEHHARLLGCARGASSATEEISHALWSSDCRIEPLVRWKRIGSEQGKRIGHEVIGWPMLPCIEVCLRKGPDAIGNLPKVDVTRREPGVGSRIPLDAGHHAAVTLHHGMRGCPARQIGKTLVDWRYQ